MEIQMTAKQLKLTDPIRNYVQEKMEKAQKYFDHIIWGQAFLFIEKRAHNAEIIIHAPGHKFRVIATAADLYSAIDLASDKIDSQLKKYKERLKGRHKTPRAQALLAAEAVVAAAAPAGISYSVRKQPVKPQTPEQAAQELENNGQAFRVFQDKSSMQVNVIYRRSDESFGVIQPVKKGR